MYEHIRDEQRLLIERVSNQPIAIHFREPVIQEGEKNLEKKSCNISGRERQQHLPKGLFCKNRLLDSFQRLQEILKLYGCSSGSC